MALDSSLMPRFSLSPIEVPGYTRLGWILSFIYLFIYLFFALIYIQVYHFRVASVGSTHTCNHSRANDGGYIYCVPLQSIATHPCFLKLMFMALFS